MKNSTRNSISVIFAIVLVVSLSFSFFKPIQVKALTPEEELAQIEAELAQIAAEKAKLQAEIDSNAIVKAGFNAQASKLYNEVLIYKKQIKELNLQIKELKLNIKTLTSEIDKKKTDIADQETNVNNLEVESNDRIISAYVNFRTEGADKITGASIFNSEGIDGAYKDMAYKEVIQSQTNEMLRRLSDLKILLEQSKIDLATKLEKVKDSKKVLDVKKQGLDSKHAEVQAKYSALYAEMARIQANINGANNSLIAFSQEEAEKTAQAEYLKQQIFNNWDPTEPGQYVVKGTMIGRQGCTGWCTGNHLHFIVWNYGNYQDPCGYLPGGAMGCGQGGSLGDPFQGPSIFTSGYGNRCIPGYGCHFHNGVDAVGSPWNAPIFATHNGFAWKGVDPYGAKYVVICKNANCNSGLKTGYWHLSEF